MSGMQRNPISKKSTSKKPIEQRKEPGRAGECTNWRRIPNIIRYGLAFLVGLPLSLVTGIVVFALIGLNLSAGQKMLEEKLPSLTGDMVHLSGLSGAIPWHIHLNHLELQDKKGVWLVLDKADLRWSPLALLGMKLHVSSLVASHLAYWRNPVSEPAPPKKPSSSSSFSLPLGVGLDHVSVPSIEIGQKVMGHRLHLSFAGQAELQSIAPFMKTMSLESFSSSGPEARLALEIRRLDDPARLTLYLLHHKRIYQGDLHFEEGKNGFVTLFGKMPELDPLVLDLGLKGRLDHLEHVLTLHSGPIYGQESGMLDIVHLTGDIGMEVRSPALSIKPGIGWGSLGLFADLHGDLRHPLGLANLDMSDLEASGSGASHIQLVFRGNKVKGDSQDDKTYLHMEAAATGTHLPGKNPLILAATPLVVKGDFYPDSRERNFALALDHNLLSLILKGEAAPALRGKMTLHLPDLAPWAAMGGVALKGSTTILADFFLPEANKEADKKTDQKPDPGIKSKMRPKSGLQTLPKKVASQVSNDKEEEKETLAHLNIEGDFDFREGLHQAVALIGRDGHLSLKATRDKGGKITLQTLDLKGHTLDFAAHGIFDEATKNVDFTSHLGLSHLEGVHPALEGELALETEAKGGLADFAVKSNLEGNLGVNHPNARVIKGPVSLGLNVEHLPSHPVGKVRLEGTLDRMPLSLKADFSHNIKGKSELLLDELSWKSLHGQGHFILAEGQKIPLGDLDLTLKKFEDFRGITGQPLSGTLALGVHIINDPREEKEAEKEEKKITLSLSTRAALGDYGVQSLSLKGQARHFPAWPDMDLTLDAKGLKAKEIIGSLTAKAKGPQDAISLDLSGRFNHVLDAPAQLDLSLLLNLAKKTVNLKKFLAIAKGEKVRLLNPVTASFGDVTAIDRLRLDVVPPHGTAMQIDAAGKIKPALALKASITHVTPALAEPFVPSLKAAGEISAQANLQGSFSAPRGNIVLEGRGLRMREGPVASLPDASFRVRGNLDGARAILQSEIEAGSRLNLALGGAVPFDLSKALSVTTKGHIDLRLANPILGASAMGARGNILIDLAAHGTVKKPQLTGRILIQQAGFNHYSQGVHLENIDGILLAQGDNLSIQHLGIKAGRGTMGLTGNIGILRPGLPLDLHFVMDKAQPLRSDMIEEVLNANIHIFGQLKTRIDVAGSVDIPSATINIPNSMPSSVPQLEVIDPEKEAHTPRQPPLIIGLNIGITSPGNLFVRGHGLFAEMQGNLHIGGISTDPEITGGFSLRRGSFNLAGINLTFSKGIVGFNGSVSGGKFDPTIDFQANRNADGVLASLLVTGYASAPKLGFSSSPTKSQDEILAILLFGKSRASLSPVQLASLGAALVQIGGGSAFDPLSTVRNTLGLDQLTIGGGGAVDNGGTSVEAGKYVMKGVYVGASEGLSGSGGSQAKVKVDLTQHLKLNTTVGTGGQVTGFTTPENDPGSSVGLSYETDY